MTPEEMNIDHKIPRSFMKTRKEVIDIKNLVICCRFCNQLKGKMTYEEFINE